MSNECGVGMWQGGGSAPPPTVKAAAHKNWYLTWATAFSVLIQIPSVARPAGRAAGSPASSAQHACPSLCSLGITAFPGLPLPPEVGHRDVTPSVLPGSLTQGPLLPALEQLRPPFSQEDTK